ncbi:MAG: efflux RND transporter periplasmic adaptor subunit [Burkholderiales bacterium]|nr:efflux RND transporter periplasmic adaptor subunit [Burkholderiales bacterium]
MPAWSAALAGPAATAPSRLARTPGLYLAPSLALSLALAACSPGADRPAAAPPPPEVGVVTVQPATVALVTELPGRTEASRVAQVRARAAGIVQRRLFREGSDVRAGQPLFTIDDAPYRAALAAAQAQLARARATLTQAAAQAERDRPLLAAQAVSQQEYMAAQAAQQQAAADVAAGQAAVQTAQLNLGYAHVTAPIAGRIGRALVTEGALVGQGEATPLAVVQRIDPLYVNFTQSAAQLMRLRAQIAGGRLVDARGPASAAVTVLLEDGSVYPLRGRLLFSDVTVDPSSDQVTLRAEIPNPQHVLLPGLYVRVRLAQAQAPGAMLLPQQAVQRGGAGDTVQVVGADGRVSARPVQVGSAQGGQWVVLSGLRPGEQVMVDGFQKLRGNAPVKAVPWQPPAAPDAPASAGVSQR